MATICFFMLSEPGHLNGPLKLAKSLRASGHQLCFFGNPDWEWYVRREGFEYIPVFVTWGKHQGDVVAISTFLFSLIGRSEIVKYDWRAIFARAVEAIPEKERRETTFRDLNLMVEKVKGAKPDLIFIDYYLLPIAFIFNNIGIKTAIMNPTLIDFQLTDIPPPYLLSNLKLPVINLCPRQFEPFDSQPKGYPCYYIEASVDLDRHQEKFQWNQLKKDQPLFFCSFGSQLRIYSRAWKVIQTVIDAMAAKPEWQMVFSLGGQLTAKSFRSVPSNVLLLNIAPQLEVLKKASIMITHGGWNSIKECIFFGVPMIVIPFDVDQPSNASKVAHHGLGLTEAAETISVSRIHSMIEMIANDPSFKTRVGLMSRYFKEVEESGIGVKTVLELLGESHS